MWGTSSPGHKLTGDFGNEPDATSISDRDLFRLLAGNLSPGVFRLLQHNPTATNLTSLHDHVRLASQIKNHWNVLSIAAGDWSGSHWCSCNSSEPFVCR